MRLRWGRKEEWRWQGLGGRDVGVVARVRAATPLVPLMAPPFGPKAVGRRPKLSNSPKNLNFPLNSLIPSLIQIVSLMLLGILHSMLSILISTPNDKIIKSVSVNSNLPQNLF